MLPRALLLFLAACAAAPEPTPEDRLVSALQVARHPESATALLDGSDRLLEPRARLVYLPTPCRPLKGANPILVLPPQSPQVGRPVQLSILTTWLEPRPDLVVVVAVGPALLQPFFDLTASGAPGCQLMVSWTALQVLLPGQQSAGMWVHSGPGQWDLLWKPGPANANQQFCVQAAVASPRDNRSGIVVTSAAQLWVAGP